MIDVRVVAATNRDLVAAADTGAFRADLYDRLNVVPLQLPPLRARRSDIPILAKSFLALAAQANDRQSIRLDDGAFRALSGYGFPGDVRELRNLIERLVILTPDDTIGENDVKNCLHGAPERTCSACTGPVSRFACSSTGRSAASWKKPSPHTAAR